MVALGYKFPGASPRQISRIPHLDDFPFPLRAQPSHSFAAMDSNDAATELIRTYTESGGINYLDAAAMLPSRPAIETACVDLMSLMFPGFHGEPLGDSSDLPDVPGSRIRRLHARMKPEISKSFNKLERDAADEKADEILTWFMSELGR